jgi:hypothetical protein
MSYGEKIYVCKILTWWHMTSLYCARDILPRIYSGRLFIRGASGAMNSLLVVHKLINGGVIVVDAKKSDIYERSLFYIN